MGTAKEKSKEKMSSKLPHITQTTLPGLKHVCNASQMYLKNNAPTFQHINVGALFLSSNLIFSLTDQNDSCSRGKIVCIND